MVSTDTRSRRRRHMQTCAAASMQKVIRPGAYTRRLLLRVFSEARQKRMARDKTQEVRRAIPNWTNSHLTFKYLNNSLTSCWYMKHGKHEKTRTTFIHDKEHSPSHGLKAGSHLPPNGVTSTW